MSDSDDTELLVLIPPDFFLAKDNESERSFRSVSVELQNISCNCSNPSNIIFFDRNNIIEKSSNMASSQHYHLPPRQQKEIDKINQKLSQVEKSFAAIDSDISTLSNCTVRSNFASAPVQNSNNYFSSNAITSTPKNLLLPGYRERFEDDNGILREIDKYLEEKSHPTNYNYCQNNIFKNESPSNQIQHPSNAYINSSSDSFNNLKNQTAPNPLISLNDLWNNKNMESIPIKTTLTQFHEERLRRQHCEKTIHVLQGKLLEYQQKISVALQVDKSKDNAISNLQEENQSLKDNFKKLDENMKALEKNLKEENNKFQNELSDIKLSKDCLEKELSQALNLAAKFQDKNEILEVKVDNFTKSTDEVKTLYKRQIDDMEIQVLNAKKSEEIANIELKKLQDLLAKTQHDEEKASKQATSYKKHLDSLNSKVRNLEKVEEENKHLNESISKLSKREKELSKELESQKITLKSHYQHQLEKVVEQKLVEFQSQLDSVEETIKSEAREREKTIAERAIKQLEMINDKSEQEILLINEKHSEEVELYRIQLINASKRIDELEETLSTFRSRRVDMAEKLHTVMETQWQKALEILTSPTTNVDDQKPINPKNLNKDKLDGLSADSGITKPENDSYDTPTSSRNQTYNRKHDERLQAYIELLLSKSPRDIDNLNTILNIPKNDLSSNERSKRTTNSQYSKPPWK